MIRVTINLLNLESSRSSETENDNRAHDRFVSLFVYVCVFIVVITTLLYSLFFSFLFFISQLPEFLKFNNFFYIDLEFCMKIVYSL